MKKILPIIASLTVLVFVGALCSQPVDNQATNASPNNNVVQGEDGDLSGDSFKEPTKTQEEAAALVQTADLSGVQGFEGSGKASRYFENNYVLNIDAELLDPPVGYFYEAWIQKSDGDHMSVGKIEKSGSAFMLEYNNDQDMDEYQTVIISQETEKSGQDGQMETKVLEGTFN
ncbi:hypothetical protein KKC88_06300 [Patescibacteria group bacterium]|nr:hypothetical protein [Patescibacteria group bacterium]MBU1673907.1 hypothetical protein [Patescibacteria group bacterium]